MPADKIQDAKLLDYVNGSVNCLPKIDSGYDYPIIGMGSVFQANIDIEFSQGTSTIVALKDSLGRLDRFVIAKKTNDGEEGLTNIEFAYINDSSLNGKELTSDRFETIIEDLYPLTDIQIIGSEIYIDATGYSEDQFWLSKNAFCNYEDLAELYYVFFDMVQADGTPDFTYPLQNMVTAINQSVPQNGYCYCPSMCSMTNLILNDPDLPSYLSRLALNSTIEEFYNLDPVVDITTLDDDLRYMLYNQVCKSSSIMSPCDGAYSIDDISSGINSYVQPGSTFTSLEDLSNVLVTLGGGIVLYPSVYNDPSTICAYETLIEGEDNLYCSTFTNFLSNNPYTLYIDAQEFPGGSFATGITTTFNDGFLIQVNTTDIAGRCISETVKTLLHEGIHAELLRRLASCPPETPICATYDPLLSSYFNAPSSDIPDGWQHEMMAREYFSQLRDALQGYFEDLTSQELDVLVWRGLQNTKAFQDQSTYSLINLTSVVDNLRMNCQKDCD